MLGKKNSMWIQKPNITKITTSYELFSISYQISTIKITGSNWPDQTGDALSEGHGERAGVQAELRLRGQTLVQEGLLQSRTIRWKLN